MSFFDLSQRRWIYFVGVYLILLLASSVVRWTRAEKLVPENKKSIVVSAVKNDELLENAPARIAYQEFAPPSETNKLPLILIHGSPGDGESLTALANNLSRDRRVFVPDLPGFGDSSRKIPDYSFRAHAFYLKEFAERLNIPKFHALGFSMGGGVVLNLEDIASEKIASIEMVSAIGVQEYELLGDYRLNHFLHGAQLAGLWTLENLVPHFGFLDDSFFGTSYAKNFYDSDQRPLRGILQKIEQPVLIVHGASDPLVPIKAAREHQRIVPQSEYHELGDNHFMIFQRPETVAPIVNNFLTSVEKGAAKTKANADADRIGVSNNPFKLEMVMADGSTALIFFLALALATFVSEDLALLTAGALAGQGQISLTLAIAACFVGIFAGDMLLYFAGRFFGRAAVRRAPLRWFVSENSLKRGAAWLDKNGMSAVFLSRVTPGLRLPIYFAAGVVRTRFLSFTLFFAIAAAVWTPLVVGATAWVSSSAMGMMKEPMFSREFWLTLFSIVVSAFIVLHFALRAATWRGRRMLAGTFLRWRKWEFWSLRTFYLPIIVYIGWLAIKFKSLSVFADANPAIEAGGFVGEPKREIYEGLRESPAAERHLLKYVFIPANLDAAQKLSLAENFIRENDLPFPIAFKPNAGERGAGVFLIKTAEELKRRLEESRTDLIVQEFAGGCEFGVFYYRYPNQETGKIYAITEKQFPSVMGDGKANLEALILRDKRAVALADAYLTRNAERLEMIPANGEKIRIIDIGTHSKGAIFLDGGYLKTDTLEAEIDRVCRGYKGFHFGRFDLRSASKEAFGRGEFKIIELNGVTSEATSIYDPKNSIFDAYRILFKQWKIAFEIGSENRKRGAKQTTVFELAKLIWRTRFGTIPIKKSEVQSPESEIKDVSDSLRA